MNKIAEHIKCLRATNMDHRIYVMLGTVNWFFILEEDFLGL